MLCTNEVPIIFFSSISNRFFFVNFRNASELKLSPAKKLGSLIVDKKVVPKLFFTCNKTSFKLHFLDKNKNRDRASNLSKSLNGPVRGRPKKKASQAKDGNATITFGNK